MVALAAQTLKGRQVGRENMRKQGMNLPMSETQLAYVPLYHASKWGTYELVEYATFC